MLYGSAKSSKFNEFYELFMTHYIHYIQTFKTYSPAIFTESTQDKKRLASISAQKSKLLFFNFYVFIWQCTEKDELGLARLQIL